jgi:hypothetical protein
MSDKFINRVIESFLRIGMQMPDIGPSGARRCVGRTQSIEEAEMLVKKFEAQGFIAEIIRKSQAGLTLYEVWVSRQPDVFSGKG